MTEPETKRAPIGYIAILVVVGLYLAIRLFEAVICMGDWLFDAGTCPW